MGQLKESLNIKEKHFGSWTPSKTSLLNLINLECLFSNCKIYNAIYYLYILLVWRDPGVSLKGRISRLPGQPCWLYAWIALQQHSPILRELKQSENWLSSRCLTSVIVQELVFPS